MYDSVTLDEIPTSAGAVAGYVGGAFHTFPELERRWPHAHRLSIAVNSGEDAECLDVETGDAVPGDAPGWFHRQIARGVVKPVFYANLSVVPSVIAELERAGISRQEYRVWDAHYTGVPHVSPGSDATQWTDRALGRNLDESLCSDAFFRPVAPAKVSPLDVLLDPERRLVNTYEVYIKHPRLHPHGLAVTRAAMVTYRKLIWLAAMRGSNGHGGRLRPGWGIHNRAARYELLLARTEGLG